MLTFIFGAITSLILFIIPGYLLSTFSSFRNNSTIERVYFGFVLNMAIFILIGFILSYLKIFTPFWILVFLVIYTIFSIMLYLKYSKYSKINYNNDRSHISKKIMILFFILALLISFVYTQLSPFPIGHDRGVHFGRSIFLLHHRTLPTTHPGTNYAPFYFQGPNIILSTFIGSNAFFSNLSPTIRIYEFNLLMDLSTMFKFFFALLVSLTVLGIYFISNTIYKNKKISILSSLIFVSLSGFDIADVGSIGTILAFIFLSVFFVYLFSFLESDLHSNVDYLFFSLIIIAIIFTHIIGVTFMAVLLISVFCWKVFKKELKIKQLQRVLTFMTISILFSLLFLSLFHPTLKQGIIDMIIRRMNSTSEINAFSPIGVSFIEYFTKSFNMLLNIEVVMPIILVFSIGFLVDIKKKASIMIPFALSSALFAFIPILSFVRPQSYLIYPLCILGGLGLFYVLRFIMKGKNQLLVIIFIFTIIGVVSSTNNVFENGLSRLYYNYDTYKETYNLSAWLNKELDSPHTILFPGSGASAYLLNSLSHNKILFAEPRYPDMPSYQETSKVYTMFRTNIGVFDYRNISSEERCNILNKYNISVIIETKIHKSDIESFKLCYSKVEVYHPTSSYWVIILEKSMGEMGQNFT